MDSKANRRLVTFMLLSLLLHLLLLGLLSRLPAPAPAPTREEPLVVELLEPEKPAPEKTAKTFDMMEVKEGLSDVPASLSKKQAESLTEEKAAPPPPSPAPPVTQPQPDQAVAEKQPPPAEKAEPPPEPKEPPPGRGPDKPRVVRKPPEKPAKDRVVERPAQPPPREIPSVRDLIPSINDIWAMRAPGGSLYRHPEIVQDGVGERQAKAAYDEYLAEFKSRVKMNWKVRDDPYMHASTTVLLIVINPDGTLQSVKKIQSSGMPEQDTGTVFAVRNSFPMRPPPEILRDENGLLTIHFSFHFLVRSAADSPAGISPGLGRWAPRPSDPGCVPPCYRW